jgi:multidrug efflux pump subunit AcrA (membrane-fusion protein)
MYARVKLTVASGNNALVVPRNAVVDVDGRQGVFVPREAARHVPVGVGLQNQESAPRFWAG